MQKSQKFTTGVAIDVTLQKRIGSDLLPRCVPDKEFHGVLALRDWDWFGEELTADGRLGGVVGVSDIRKLKQCSHASPMIQILVWLMIQFSVEVAGKRYERTGGCQADQPPVCRRRS